MSRSPQLDRQESNQAVPRRPAGSLRRWLEPRASRLLDWCRAPDERAEVVEETKDEVDAPPVTSTPVDEADPVPDRFACAEERINALEVGAEQARWGREAVVERMNHADEVEGLLRARVSEIEAALSQLDWGRQALVERLNVIEHSVEAQSRRSELLRLEVEEQIPIPMAFGLDALAMGRRLAALEDHVESLQLHLARSEEVTDPATLVAFSPRMRVQAEVQPEKHVG